MKPAGGSIQRKQDRGFSIIELMVSVFILSIVIAIVMQGANEVQQRNRTEVSKLDTTQQAREFMDQIVNDIHQSGYPSVRMFDPAVKIPGTNPVNIACGLNCDMVNGIGNGLMQVTPTLVQFEGDVDGSGTVSEVYLQLVQPAAGCPCTIQRGTTTKAAFLAGAVPVYFTEVNNVQNTNIFTAYNFDGVQLVPPAANPADVHNIKTIGILIYVQSTIPDPQTGLFPNVTMSSEAKVNN